MRVHHIINDYNIFTGGAQRVVRALHTGLRKRGMESFILGLLEQRDHDLDHARSLNLHNPYGWRAIWGIHHYFQRNVKPGDIVHVHLFPSLIYVSFLNLLGKKRYYLVCTEHSTSNRRRGTWIGRILDVMTYAGYDRVITISNGVQQELLNWKPDLKEKTRMIPNGVELRFKEFTGRTVKRHLKVVSIGNLRPAKNYETALMAIGLIRELDFEYWIAGQGSCRECLLQLRRELGLDSKVHLLGFVDSIQDLLASADIFLIPSRWEGFGLAAVEAMNASLPLVAGNVAGLRDIVEGDEPCALLVDPASPRAIAEALQHLLASPELRVRMGKSAFTRAQKFSLDKMVEAHFKLYGELV